MYIYMYIYRLKAGGSPELPGTPQSWAYTINVVMGGVGVGGWGGCNNVMWSVLDWELWKPWGCCFVEDVVTLQVSLLFTEGGRGGGRGVITSCGVRWIESCGNLEDVASLKMLLRCRRPMVPSLQATASKSLCGREDEKGVMFISSMVLQWIMTFSSYQQNDQKCMKPQFQWLECCTHVWPSMEDVMLSFFCADKRQVYPRRHWNFGWSNTFREKHKTQ